MLRVDGEWTLILTMLWYDFVDFDVESACRMSSSSCSTSSASHSVSMDAAVSEHTSLHGPCQSGHIGNGAIFG